MTSLRFRLLFILIGLFILAWFGVLIATYTVTRSRVEELFDAHLQHDANVLAALAVHSLAKGDDAGAVAHDVTMDFQHYQKELAFQVWKGSRLLLRSAGSPAFAKGASGYRDVILAGGDWRLFAHYVPAGGLVVQVAEPHRLRSSLAVAITRKALYPLVLAIPLLGVALWFGVGRGLLPLRRVASQVAERSPARLDAVDLKTVPQEIDVVVRELNRLLAMLRDAFERERQFTAEAAHEIRTPLASIKTQAQVALRAADDGSRRRALAEVIQGVDRAGRLVGQLLTLARVDRETLRDEFAEVNVAALANQITAELKPHADAKRIILRRGANAPVVIYGSAAGLGILVRNLIDNAIAYTAAGGVVDVTVNKSGPGVDLTVTDNGPGIPPAERGRIFDRFHRGAGSLTPGCGLGLSIVRGIAQLHGGSVTLADPPRGRGLRVRVHLPDAGGREVVHAERQQA
ncbi:MAG: ATP-binding protein [Gammaproteobacteria bacterium]